jgi:SAM-dependent methyltransferase
MDQFSSQYQSHLHSLKTLNLLYEYDSFLDSIKVIADMGAGAGYDTKWWSELQTRDDPQEPRGIWVYAIDRYKKFEPDNVKGNRVKQIISDFETVKLPTPVDLIWCHDSFQYVLDPIKTLRNWNRLLQQDGMLILSFPQLSSYVNRQYSNRVYSNTYYNHNIVSLMYMLGVCGFDCNDAYFYRDPSDKNPWIHAAVYKASDPLDPATTTLWDLASENLLNPSAIACLEKHGHLRQEEILTTWFDKDFYRVV